MNEPAHCWNIECRKRREAAGITESCEFICWQGMSENCLAEIERCLSTELPWRQRVMLGRVVAAAVAYPGCAAAAGVDHATIQLTMDGLADRFVEFAERKQRSRVSA